MLTVYGDIMSGNCYKVKLLMQLLTLEHDWRHVDVLAGEAQSAEFKAMSPNAKIPVLVLDDGQSLCESNAILNYLAEGSAFLPRGGLERARVLQWQFFEQYSHEPYIAVARFIQRYLGMPADRIDEYHAKHEGGYRALDVMEQQLSQFEFLVGESLTIADISLYAYTHVADEGGFELSAYPKVRAWLSRIAENPAYVGME